MILDDGREVMFYTESQYLHSNWTKALKKALPEDLDLKAQKETKSGLPVSDPCDIPASPATPAQEVFLPFLSFLSFFSLFSSPLSLKMFGSGISSLKTLSQIEFVWKRNFGTLFLLFQFSRARTSWI